MGVFSWTKIGDLLHDMDFAFLRKEKLREFIKKYP